MPSTSKNPIAELSPLHQTLLEVLGEKKDSGQRSPEHYLYVIYVRKSTDRAEKQQESLGDQLAECKRLAGRYDLKVANVYSESVSAKTSGVRPEFRKMLTALEEGKYDGIITWAPDRLARNMREGGEIIDMLDNGIIKDLVFPNARYTTGSADKLALGISFVLAKQWVDTHASNVKRAIVRRSEEGVYMGKAKHGYYKDRNGYMRPDDANWTLIKEVFDRRMKGETLSTIADWLKAEEYPKQTRHGKRTAIILDEAFVSSIVKEPIYAGISVYGEDVINLRTAYDFQPMISEEDFCSLNGYDGIDRHVMSGRKKKEIRANFLRGMVICVGCDLPLAPTITTKPKERKQYFYYRCDTKGCKYYRVNVRAKLLIDAAIDFVKSHPITKPHVYDHFVKEVHRIAEEQRVTMANESRSLEQKRNAAKRELADLKEMMRRNDDRAVQLVFAADLKKMALKIRELDLAIKKLTKKREALKEQIPSYEKFVELTQNLADVLANIKVIKQLDWSFRKLFSNFYLEGKKVAKITQNSPWRELCLDADSAMVNHPPEMWNLILEELKQLYVLQTEENRTMVFAR